VVRELFDHLRDTVRAIGPVTVYAQKTRVVFQGRVRFAGAQPRRQWLDVTLWLTRRRAHPRMRRVERVVPGCYVHYFRFDVPGQMDDDFRALVGKSYEVGQREHFPIRR
jgi:hypothetical protein